MKLGLGQYASNDYPIYHYVQDMLYLLDTLRLLGLRPTQSYDYHVVSIITFTIVYKMCLI